MEPSKAEMLVGDHWLGGTYLNLRRTSHPIHSWLAWFVICAGTLHMDHFLGCSDKDKPGVIEEQTPGLIRITSCLV